MIDVMDGWVLVILAAALWIACGQIARAACWADFIGDGAGEPPLYITSLLSVSGPIGLIVAVFVTAGWEGKRRRPFYHGLRWGR